MATANYWYSRWYLGDGTLIASISITYNDATLRINQVDIHNGAVGHTLTATVTDAGTGAVVAQATVVGGQPDFTSNIPGNKQMVPDGLGGVMPPTDYHYSVTWT